MTESGRETEVKFFVRRLSRLQGRIEALGGRLQTPRTREFNLRYDTPDGALRRLGSALRLRRDAAIRLTFKGPSQLAGGARSRDEYEITVGDFDSTQHILDALGYVVVFEYEKYRTTYELAGARVMLDVLPFGDFLEIEGNIEILQPVAAQLGLTWSAAIPESYHALFERLSLARGLPFRDLTFDNFEGRSERPAIPGVESADP